VWDALDVVVLAGITPETEIDKLPETSAQVAIIDLVIEDLPYHAYRIDFEPAFMEMFRLNDGPSFNVDSAAWMQQVLADIYANLEERKPGKQVMSMPATFHP
jgi:hypothetical protein